VQLLPAAVVAGTGGAAGGVVAAYGAAAAHCWQEVVCQRPSRLLQEHNTQHSKAAQVQGRQYQLDAAKKG
jgi:shikimate 5-dehydrogenase